MQYRPKWEHLLPKEKRDLACAGSRDTSLRDGSNAAVWKAYQAEVKSPKTTPDFVWAFPLSCICLFCWRDSLNEVCFPDSHGGLPEMELGSGGERVYSASLILQNSLDIVGSDRHQVVT